VQRETLCVELLAARCHDREKIGTVRGRLEQAAVGGVLAARRDDPDATLVEYEKVMFVRTAKAAAEAAKTHALCFGGDAPQGLVDFSTSASI
jgi:hypothetical protein